MFAAWLMRRMEAMLIFVIQKMDLGSSKESKLSRRGWYKILETKSYHPSKS
jgi:hypothetical protein